MQCTRAFIAELRRDRDQIWAEAVAAYRAGEKWWPEAPDEVALCAEEQERRYQVDSWEDVIGRWLIGRSETCVDEVLLSALNLDRARMGRAEQMRAAAALRRLGYSRVQVRVGARRTWVYRCATPAAPAVDDDPSPF